MKPTDEEFTKASAALRERFKKEVSRYPPLPGNCEIEPGRRQLAVGEMAYAKTDRGYDKNRRVWYALRTDIGINSFPVDVGIYSRAIEESK